jgi:colanic acid/amylovoran biosynthesis glycosyltransferase
LLKVAHIKEVYLPISETFIYSYLKNMKGVESYVVAERLENEQLFPFERKRILREDTAAFQAYARIVQRVTGSPKTGFLVLPRSPHAERACREVGADVIHAHGGYDGFRHVHLKKRLGLPYLVTFYGRDIGAGSRHPYWRKAYGILFGLGDLFLVEGPAMREKLLALGCPPAKIKLQRIGIDLSLFSGAHRRRSIGGEAKVLMCGRMVEKKGLEYGIRAFAMASKSSPGARMLVVGDGPKYCELRSLVSSLGLDGRVEFLGSVPYERYISLSRDTDIFVQPSITARDGDSEGGAPTTVLEMQAAGIPVVSTYHDDIPNVVDPGGSAFLVREKDTEALAEKIELLLGNAELRETMGIRGREHVSKGHDIHALARELEGTYGKLAQVRGAG